MAIADYSSAPIYRENCFPKDTFGFFLQKSRFLSQYSRQTFFIYPNADSKELSFRIQILSRKSCIYYENPISRKQKTKSRTNVQKVGQSRICTIRPAIITFPKWVILLSPSQRSLHRNAI